MALNKTELFEEQDKKLAGWAKALGHPARIAILRVLARRHACICGDITDELPLAQSTVSQHLKVLKEAGLIKGEIEGVRTCYCLNEEVIPQVREHFGSFAEMLNKTFNKTCC